MSYNPFDDLPSTSQKEGYEKDEKKILEEDEQSKDGESAFKRRRLESSKGTAEVDCAECKEDFPEESVVIKSENIASSKEFDVVGALHTLSKHLQKEKKQERAFQLLQNLADSKLSELNSNAFFETLQDYCGKHKEPLDATNMLSVHPCGFEAVVKLYYSRSDMFDLKQKFLVQNWYLRFVVAKDLSCDDSFQFSKACRTVSELFENNIMFPKTQTIDYIDPDENADESEGEEKLMLSLKRERVAITVCCLAIAFPMYNRRDWARQPLDSLFRTVSQRRMKIDTEQRNDIDALVTKLTLAHRKNVSGKPVQTVRSYNSTSHPLQTKKVGVMR